LHKVENNIGLKSAVIVIDSTTLMTSGYRKTAAKDDAEPNARGDSEKAAGNLKAGTIMVAIDPTGPSAKPCLIQVQGGKDVDSWKAFFATLEKSPEWVVADLDPAIARAVRETWPEAILYHSRRHLAERMRVHAIADGVPNACGSTSQSDLPARSRGRQRGATCGVGATIR